MKKIVSVLLLAVILISAAAVAEVDLSRVPFDDLLALRDQVQRELISRPEWKAVEVPAGTWYVGTEIPAGDYSLYPATDRGSVIHLWGKAIDDYNTDGGMIISTYLRETTDGYGKVELKSGNILVISKPVILAPVQSFGF